MKTLPVETLPDAIRFDLKNPPVQFKMTNGLTLLGSQLEAYLVSMEVNGHDKPTSTAISQKLFWEIHRKLHDLHHQPDRPKPVFRITYDGITLYPAP